MRARSPGATTAGAIRRHDHDLSDIRVRRQDAVAAGRAGGHRQSLSRASTKSAPCAGADRIARGEEWLQTNTLDGGKPHEAFIKPNEPGYFQEFGPGGFHVSIGFANPKIINDATRPGSAIAACRPIRATPTLTVHVSNTHMSRTPDQRTYSSGSYDHYAFTQCYVSVGAAGRRGLRIREVRPGRDSGHVQRTCPAGTYKIAVFDQWNDIMLDGLVSTVMVNGNTDQGTAR